MRVVTRMLLPVTLSQAAPEREELVRLRRENRQLR